MLHKDSALVWYKQQGDSKAVGMVQIAVRKRRTGAVLFMYFFFHIAMNMALVADMALTSNTHSLNLLSQGNVHSTD